MTTIGVRFVVEEALARDVQQAKRIESRLGEHIAELNSYFRNSKVDLRAELVGVDFAAIESSDADQVLRAMSREESGFGRLFSIADEYGADYTFAVVGKLLIRGVQRCGKAFAVNTTPEQLASTRRALAVVDIRCGAHSIAHELGHLMGLNHGHKVAECQPGFGHTTAVAPYANGFATGACDGVPSSDKFGTIMVGGWMKAINGDGHSSLRLFSNPRIRDSRCGQDGVCGDPEIADAARALNENAHYFASHEEPDVHTLKFRDAAVLSCMTEQYKYYEINEVVDVECPQRGIEDLRGLEQLRALRRINLSGNRIRQLPDEFVLMTKDVVQYIDIYGNDRFDCSSLQTFANTSATFRLPEHCRGVNWVRTLE